MKKLKARQILIEHNKWRRGIGKYDTAPDSPKIIGEAIDVAIQVLKVKPIKK